MGFLVLRGEIKGRRGKQAALTDCRLIFSDAFINQLQNDTISLYLPKNKKKFWKRENTKASWCDFFFFQRKSQQMLRRDDGLAGRGGYKLDAQGQIMTGFYDGASKQQQNQCWIWKCGLQELLEALWFSWRMVQCRKHFVRFSFFLQSIFTNLRGMFFIVSSSAQRTGCLPWEWMSIRAHLTD